VIDNQLREPPRRSTRYSGASLIGPPRTVIWVLGSILAALLVYALRDLVLILLLSVFLAYFINPIVKIVESRVIKREIAVALVYLGIVLSLLALAYFVFPLLRAEINALSEGWPSFTDRLDDAIDSIQNEIVLRFPSADRLLTTREVRYQKLNGFIEQQMANIPALSGRVASMVVAGLLIPFFSYFFLRDSRKIIQFVLDRLAARHIETSVAVWCEINRIVGRYLRGLAINSVLVGTVAAVGLWMMGVNYPLLLGVLTGLANVVPYVGPIIGGAATAVVALIQFKSLSPLINVLAFYLGLKLVNFLIIQPKTMAGGKELHPVLFIASIIVGGHILGVLGMIIAVPIVTIFQESVRLLIERRRYSTAGAGPEIARAVQIQPYVC
jgi:predicted PurR-regulated permease PerM